MTPARFRRKPQTVEAVQYDGTEESLAAIRDWLGNGPRLTVESYARQLYVTAGDESFRLVLVPGQWLARDGDGRLHVLDDADLAENYEMEGDGE